MLNNLIELVKEHVLGIEQGGSSVNPYIKNPRDKDIFLIVEDYSKKQELGNLIQKTFGFKKLTENGLDIVIKLTPSDLSESIYWYLSNYMKPFDGYIKITPELDINKDKIEKIVFNWVNMLKILDNKYNHKYFYHIYTSLCILKHNSFELTEEEINNINILHDRKEEDFNIRKQLIDQIIQEVELCQQI